jgi:hypothetical protein
MFKLTESFKEEFKKHIEEKTLLSDYNKSLKEFEDAQRYSEEGFEIINEYFNYYGSALNEVQGQPPLESKKETAQERIDRNTKEKVSASVPETLGNVFNFIMKGEPERERVDDYQPLLGHAKIESITSMRFPENVIFFFQQLISWIVNLVKKFISFFTNAIRRLFDLGEGPRFDESLKLNLQKSKKIESIAMPLLNKKDYTTRGNIPDAVSLVGIDPSDWERVKLGAGLFEQEDREGRVFKSTDDYPAKGKVGFATEESRQVKAIDINISKEMEGIHQLLQYFLDLFDNSYGSNREHLFGTEDLEMLLELFRTTIKNLTSGEVSTTAISGKMTSMDLISADKLKDNLIRTKINTDNLKKVYVQIEESITNMLAILSHKQLVAVENLGVSYRFYSASTYIQMIKILDTLKPRVKQAEQMEKDLKKMKDIFDKIVVQLGKMRTSLIGYGEVTYSSVYQKKIAELFDSSRYVSQTISLRLATLGLFIRQLRDIRESIYNVNSVNERNKDFLKKQVFQF